MGIERELFAFSRYVDGGGNLHRASRLNIAGATATYNATTDTLTLSGLGGGGSNTLLGLADTPGAYTGQALRLLRVNAGETAVEFAANSFLNLADTPATYSGQGSRFVRVNAGATALEFTSALTTFLGLTDTPATYAGQALKLPRVNAGATGLEFVTDDLLRLVDVPNTYVGQALKLLRVNAGETAVEFTAATDGLDSTAIHDDTAAEISVVTESTQAEHGDVFLGESAGASPAFSKRRYTGETLNNLSALGLTDAVGSSPAEFWTGDDVGFTSGNLNTTITFRRAQGSWITSGSPPTTLDWLGSKPVVHMDTNDRLATTTSSLMTPHHVAPNGYAFAVMIAFKLRADGAGSERTLWTMQNSANESGSRKRLYVTTGGVIKYESRDSSGVVRDDVGATVLPTDTELIATLSVAASGNVSVAYTDENTEALVSFGTAASGSGTLTGLDTMSVGGALVGGATANCTRGYIRAFAYWPGISFSSARAYRALRAAKYFAPVSGGDGGGGGGSVTVDPLVLTEVANGAAPTQIANKTILWAAASGQLFYRKDSGEIVGL